MPTFHIDPNLPILVEIDTVPAPGEELTSKDPVEKLAGKAEDAVSHALSTIYNMADGLQQTVQQMKAHMTPPDDIELSFGLTLDAALGNALIAKTGVTADMNVKLIWREFKDEQ